MLLSEIIHQGNVQCDVQAQSKKRALEKLSEIISTNLDTISSNDVFDSLLTRERLGGTGVGYGVAIPHGRLKNTTNTFAAFIKLEQGVDYDAADQQPVDLLFALLVPEESTEEHLQILAQLAQMFSDESFRKELRGATNAEELFKLLTNWSGGQDAQVAS